MPGHVDILDEQDPVRGALLRSVALHLTIAAVVVAWGALQLGTGVERWGDPKSLGGGGVTITPVSGIRMPPREGRINPVANDTESRVPSPPKPQPKKAPVVDKDAIALKSRNAAQQQARATGPQQRTNSLKEPKHNQVYSSTGQALTSPMFTQAPGGGGVGSATGSPFGNRFGWYEQLLRDRVARNWRSHDLDARIRTRVAVLFDIARSGSISNVRVSQSSGNFALDQSAQRAILLSNPLPPLPAGFERNTATIEFWFSLQAQ
ncbi:MAG TPA: TonB family protein [Bryobacteraceae bacterium]|nr:TonB family protein [Bryobacteraceae bacterium]